MLSQKFVIRLNFDIIITELEAWLSIKSICCSSRGSEFYSQYTHGTSYSPATQLPQNLMSLASQATALLCTYSPPDTHTYQ